jgi:hypothetical protein
MAYLNNIPQPTDVPSSSQNDILNNFSSLNTQFSVDHVPLIAGSNNGYHTKVTFSDVQADPTLSFPQTELYTKTSSNGTVNDRYNDLYYYEKNTAGTSNVLQLTGGGITSASYCTFSGTTGVLTAGSYNVTSTNRAGLGSYTVTFTRPFANTNYVVSVTPNFGAGGGAFAIKLRGFIKNTGSFSFQIQNQTDANSDATTVDVICFGVLA